jgi:site-specific DNA-methyltransferase (adenine-specific)
MENLKVMIGDCRESMRALEAGSVQTCVTSPPYFGLRDYGHDGQIGLEQTPDAFVATMVEVFREVHRVLTDDGTLWVNLGDSYASAWACNRRNVIGSGSLENGKREARPNRLTDGLKEKDLIGIPWRVALALQADGWYLRQDIIWHKPNPMPESVRDRCTKAHEYIFMFSKKPKYFFDCEAIKEPVAPSSAARLAQPTLAQQVGSARVPGKTNGNMKAVGNGETRNRRSVWTVTTKPYKGAHFATFPSDLIEPCVLAGSRPGDIVLDPFGGSGTTAGVALKNGRKAILCELNPDYAALVPDRIASIAGEGWDLL